MTSSPQKQHRRSLRLKEYDYSLPGAYFISVCAYDRECPFGDVVDGEMQLSKYGEIIIQEWFKTGEMRRRVQLDAFVVMPNHIHGVLLIVDDDGDTNTPCRGTLQRAPTTKHTLTRPAPKFEKFGKPTSDSIPTIVRSFKSAVTKRINEMRKTPGEPVWQRGYYEHVIRNLDELNRVREYIQTNPARWEIDKENPQVIETELLRRKKA